ncbi:MAG: gluconokinase [Methylobacterium sp.]|uniref:gluconokinase n=1 Tax=Methylobacterium sp. TaxID=409 RepID=UPI0025D2C07A|nr:gluconokinase [Methylobacterium sp.]MBX9933887.1 gluconokinase [Methylobacterium sp.]
MPAGLPADPQVLVVMGVSGSGKSTVAAKVAERLGWIFADGDDFHSAANVARMRSGLALGETERSPWLAAIAAWIDAKLAEGRSAVIACSALKRPYRDALVRGRPEVRIAYLAGDRGVIAERLAGRSGHFMPASLLDSQLDALEPPGIDEHPIVVPITETPDHAAGLVIEGLAAPL